MPQLKTIHRADLGSSADEPLWIAAYAISRAEHQVGPAAIRAFLDVASAVLAGDRYRPLGSTEEAVARLREVWPGCGRLASPFA